VEKTPSCDDSYRRESIRDWPSTREATTPRQRCNLGGFGDLPGAGTPEGQALHFACIPGGLELRDPSP